MKELEESNFWRVIFGFPIIIFSLAILGMIFIVRYDSPKFLINKNRQDEAMKMIKKIYHPEENFEEILHYILLTS